MLGFSAVKLATARWIDISPVVSLSIILLCIGGAIWPILRALKRIRREAARLDAVHAT